MSRPSNPQSFWNKRERAGTSGPADVHEGHDNCARKDHEIADSRLSEFADEASTVLCLCGATIEGTSPEDVAARYAAHLHAQTSKLKEAKEAL